MSEAWWFQISKKRRFSVGDEEYGQLEEEEEEEEGEKRNIGGSNDVWSQQWSHLHIAVLRWLVRCSFDHLEYCQLELKL